MKWHRNRFKSRKRKNIERKTRTIIGVSILIGVAALIIGTSYVSALEGVTIDVIEVHGNEVVDADDIERVARDTISGRYMWLYARANALIYPRREVERVIQDEFLRIQSVEVEIISMDVLRVEVVERDPYALWCGEEYPQDILPEEERCFFVDREGVIYAQAPSFSGDVFLRLYGEKKKERFENAEQFDVIQTLRTLLENEDISPTIVTIRGGDTAEVTVDDPFGYSSVLFVDLAISPEETVRNLLTLYNELTSARGENRTNPHLEYVDLRFGNRVFYNFADDNIFTD